MKAKIIFVVIWLTILLSLAMLYRLWVAPIQEAQQKDDLINSTSTNARYQDEITLNLDPFSAYAILRSPEFAEDLGSYSLGLNVVDDDANYDRRLKDLQAGKAQFAVFTIDAFIKASENLGDIPGTIIFAIDESRGADAAIGVSRVLKNVDALNDKTTKFVVVPNSPSETLARVIMSYFKLDLLEENPFVFVDDTAALRQMYLKHKPTDKHIFVTWEPYVTKMSQNPDYKVVVDSSKFRGYIVDVMVVNRDYLAKNPDRVQQFTEAYFRTLYKYRQKIPELLSTDAVHAGEPLKSEEALNIAEKIWFKNTRENYAHFGVSPNKQIQHIEDAIRNITRVLIATKSISHDPAKDYGKNPWYYNGVLSEMHDKNFFPGMTEDDESIRNDSIVKLSEDDWQHLEPVGTLQADKLVFARGSSTLTPMSLRILNELADHLKDAPQFYLMVTGNASQVGNLQANQELANNRAKAVKEYLIQAGISQDRIRAVAGEKSKETTVQFIVGQMPY